MRFYKKLAALGLIGIISMGQCISAFAASYTYSAKANSTIEGSYHYITLVGTMTGTYNYLKLAVSSIYYVRGAGPYVDGIYVKENTVKTNTISSSTPTYKQMIEGHTYYTALRCSGQYRTTSGGTLNNVGVKDVDI